MFASLIKMAADPANHPRKPCLRSLLLAAAVLGTALPSVAQAQQAVTVTINRFIQGQDPDPVQVVDEINSPDVIGDGDYYARVRVGDAPFESNRSDFVEGRDIRPFWQFSRTVTETGIIPVVIQIWDADEFENNDDIIDLNDNDNSQELVLNLNVETCSWSGDAETTASGDGDHEHFGGLEGGERGHLNFGIACSDGDFDDDGIADSEERFGVFDLVDGDWLMVVDLPGLGANPCRKTILVEVDAVMLATPLAAGLQIAQDAFDAAPVPAPDGPCPYTAIGASEGGVDLITDISDTDLPTLPNDPNYVIADVARYKAQFFPPAREPYFHYNVWVPNALPFPGRCCEGRRNTDFITEIRTGGNRARLEGALFMHELGHALGLAHSGLDNIDRDQANNPTSRNCKPNYLSIMNYTFPTGLTDLTTGTVVVDFSRRPLPTLRESQLDETTPLDNGSTLQTCWASAGGTTLCRPVNGALNWNGNLTATMPQTDVIDVGPVSVDINAIQVRGCGQSWTDDNGDGQIQNTELDPVSTPGDRLVGADDWANLIFRGPLNETGAVASGAADEPTEEQLEEAEARVQGLLRCSPPEAGEWEIGTDCTIWRDVSAPAGMRVGSGAHLRVGPGVHLDINLAAHALRIDGGSRVTIDAGARID